MDIAEVTENSMSRDMKFTQQQQTAINNPCQYAEQCSQGMYFSQHQQGKYLITAGLTVNIGEE